MKSSEIKKVIDIPVIWENMEEVEKRLLEVTISDNKYLTNLTKTKNLALENNTVFIGNILYTDYALLFLLSGIILLVAMIGAIVLTLRTRDGVKKQIIRNQIDIKKSDVIQIVNVKNREGA